MNHLEYIKMEAIALDVGQTTEVECCFCGSADKKLSITRKEDGIVYNCWRASCSGRGFIGSMHSACNKGEIKQFIPKYFINATGLPSDKMLNRLYQRYTLKESTLTANGVKEAGGEVLVMPLFSSYGERFGVTTKQWNGGKKAMHFIEKKAPMIHYTVTTLYGPKVVLVEDVLSAMRVTQLGTEWVGVALLGTDMNDEKVRDLKVYGAKGIIIALDPDATGKAYKIKKKYGLFFNSFKVAVMRDDPKDITPEELRTDLGI